MLSIKQLESATKADKSKFLHTSALSVILLQKIAGFNFKLEVLNWKKLRFPL